MDLKIIQNINLEVYRRFPDLSGRTPRVQTVRPARSRLPLRWMRRSNAYLLVYQGRKTTSTGKNLPYAVRVLTDQSGKILKITMTH